MVNSLPTMQRVLVIDDEPDIRLIAELSLSQLAGVEVMLASSGAEGLRLAEAQTPDVILLDVMMPVMDGLATLQLLQSNPELNDVPVIFLTARVQRQDRADYIERGAVGVIAKPFDPLTLPQDISKLLSDRPSAGSR